MDPQQLADDLAIIKDAFLRVSVNGHRTGYDWNADPLSLTLAESLALDKLNRVLARARAEADRRAASMRRAEYWKAEHNAANAENERLRAALQACVDCLLHDGVPGDPEHPRRVACDVAEALLAASSRGGTIVGEDMG